MRIRFIWAYAKFNGISWILKSPPNIISNLVTPLCLLFIIYALSQGRLLPFAVVGGTIAIIATNTLNTTGQSAMYRLDYRLQELLVATKASILDYVAGFTLSSLVFCLPGLAFFTLLSMAFGLFTWGRFLTTIVVVLLLAFATTSIALFVGGKIKRVVGMWAISGILSALFTLIPPTFYPYTVLTPLELGILSISPVTPAAIVLQGAYGLAPVDGLMLPLLAVETVFYMAAVRAFGRWRDN